LYCQLTEKGGCDETDGNVKVTDRVPALLQGDVVEAGRGKSPFNQDTKSDLHEEKCAGDIGECRVWV
jgi:hypothetical protein